MDKIKQLKLDIEKKEDELAYLKAKSEIVTGLNELKRSLASIEEDDRINTMLYNMYKRLIKDKKLTKEETEYGNKMLKAHEGYLKNEELQKRITEKKDELKRVIENYDNIVKDYFTEKIEGDVAVVSKEALHYAILFNKLGAFNEK